METATKLPVILYAEDDYDDFESVKEAMDQITHHFSLIHAQNGLEAIKYLESEHEQPGLIVIDLNMPIMDGKEMLAWLKNEEKFKSIPVMVFTTSSREEDIKLCQSHSCTFFRKPTLYRDLLHVVQKMLEMCHSGEAVHGA
jgi:CheY-like chemotaxis protein